jgi:hypothetical protein
MARVTLGVSSTTTARGDDSVWGTSLSALTRAVKLRVPRDMAWVVYSSLALQVMLAPRGTSLLGQVKEEKPSASTATLRRRMLPMLLIVANKPTTVPA